ncbi:MAG: hypothetical protein QOD87_1843 [Pseudonocardiales bacterium]|nr:hypothetical protein [Pseudonocardiales bacterium]
MIRCRSLAAGILVVLLAAGGVAACSKAKKTPPEQVAAQAFLDSLAVGDTQAAAAETTDAATAATTVKASLAGLSGGAAGLKGTLRVTDLTDRQASSATANYSASWALPGAGSPWTYTGSLPMVKQNGAWLVTWSSADLHPMLVTGSHLTVKRTQPARAALEDSAGKPLFTTTPVVTIGIAPPQVKDLTAVAAGLAAALKSYGIAAADIVKSVKAAPKNQFVPVITLRRNAYEAVKLQIYNLPGVQFPASTQLLGPSSAFAQPMLGRVGNATKEIIDASKGRVRAGDNTGLSGLQLALDPQLAGTAAVDVYAADSAGTLGANLGSVVPAKAGQPVKLTLDRAAQTAADAALASVTLPAAVVAVQPSTGKVLAVANSSGAREDIALTGQYPAGSTFKIATYTAEYTANPSLTPSSPVDCPATTQVNGQTFENENKFSHGLIPMSAAFAYSCNTSAINLAMKLPADAVSNAARSLGLGADWKLPVAAFSGSLPAPASPNEQAAAAIGQGKVLVSPLLMALIAGGSATGKPIGPSLVDGQSGATLPALPAALTAKMDTLERATVAITGGTANAALGDLPGNVSGKTGTAEFGTDQPPKTHAWFAGTRGDLAFAVFVYGGDSGKVPALPIVHSFLSAYHG